MTSRSFHGARRTRFAGALTTGAGAIRDANDWMSRNPGCNRPQAVSHQVGEFGAICEYFLN
jgi:hypothetical protein